MTRQTSCLLRPWCKPLVPWSGHLCGLFSTSAQERQLASNNIWPTRESTFQSRLLNRRNGSGHSAALRRLLTIATDSGACCATGLLRSVLKRAKLRRQCGSSNKRFWTCVSTYKLPLRNNCETICRQLAFTSQYQCCSQVNGEMSSPER